MVEVETEEEIKMADIVIVDPVVVPVVPVPVVPTPVVPVTPVIDPSVLANYEKFLLNLLDTFGPSIPGGFGVAVKNIDNGLHVMFAQSWFNDLFGLLLNAVKNGFGGLTKEQAVAVLKTFVKNNEG